MRRARWRNFDFVLLGVTLLAIGYGIAVINSATLASAEIRQGLLDNVVVRQALYALLGLGLMMLAAIIDYRLWGGVAHFIYILALILLLLVLAAGHIYGGAQRWFDLRLFPLQPSELAKVLLIVAMARFMADHEMGQLRNLLLSMALVIPPLVLIYLQPAFSMALVLAVIWLGMAFMAGMRFLHLGLLGLAGALSIPAILSSLEDYMRERIVAFLNPGLDPLGAGFNINQALIAVGSGGWWGQGYGSGIQSQLQFLRVRHTDFIFSVIGEELGFVGAMILFLLLTIIILRTLRAGRLAGDLFGRLIACGVATVILFQSFVNIAVNLGLLPVTGVPLPFVSYGGSSLVTLLIAQGLVQSAVMRRKKIEF
ncbi:MAG TPA: rod shape-determining protein RodA [Anaerolineae bacterium]|nr:rod shape-determining protein RodA [Anaerolineae bacterium]